jgi:hypothetical protein
MGRADSRGDSGKGADHPSVFFSSRYLRRGVSTWLFLRFLSHSPTTEPILIAFAAVAGLLLHHR